LEKRGRGCLIAGLAVVGVFVGLVGFVWFRIATGPPIYDPGDSSMFELGDGLASIDGVSDAGLRYPTVENVAGGALVLEMPDADDSTIRAAIDEASCRVWREMYLDPSFVWAAVVRAPSDVGRGSTIDEMTYLEILNPVDLEWLVGSFKAERFEHGYLQWTPAVMEQRCGPRPPEE
jgi:hypothetical protein